MALILAHSDVYNGIYNDLQKGDCLRAVLYARKENIDLSYMVHIFNNTTLLTQCTDGFINLPGLKHMLDIGISPNVLDRRGHFPLQLAVKMGNMQAIKMLVHHGAEIDMTTQYGTSALMTACDHYRIEVVRYIVDCGADINRVNAMKYSPLTLAVRNGSLDIMEFLVSQGADTGVIDSLGRNLVYHAEQRNHTKLDHIKAILKSGVAMCQ